jgi:hypothetical protein
MINKNTEINRRCPSITTDIKREEVIGLAKKRNLDFVKTLLIDKNNWDRYNIIVFGWMLGYTMLNILFVNLKMEGVVEAETLDKLENCLSTDVVNPNMAEVYPYKKVIIATVFTVIIVGGIALGVYFYMQPGSSRPASIASEYISTLEQNRELFEQIRTENARLDSLALARPVWKNVPAPGVLDSEQLSGVVTDLGEHLATSKRFLISPYYPMPKSSTLSPIAEFFGDTPIFPFFQ